MPCITTTYEYVLIHEKKVRRRIIHPPAALPACLPVYLLFCVRACLPACFFVSPPASLPACPPACLPGRGVNTYT